MVMSEYAEQKGLVLACGPTPFMRTVQKFAAELGVRCQVSLENRMERYLKDTYGITVYQEQVMLLSRLLADFTRGESDTLRKAMAIC